jgi:hypothetical protein
MSRNERLALKTRLMPTLIVIISMAAIFLAHPTWGQNCDYAVGDANNSSSLNGLDVTYGVAYFKGGPPPPLSVSAHHMEPGMFPVM